MPEQREGPVKPKQCIGCRYYFQHTCFHASALNRRPPIGHDHFTPAWCPLRKEDKTK